MSIDSPLIWANSAWRGQNWGEVGNKGYRSVARIPAAFNLLLPSFNATSVSAAFPCPSSACCAELRSQWDATPRVVQSSPVLILWCSGVQIIIISLSPLMGINYEPSPAQAGVARARSTSLICVHLVATNCHSLDPFSTSYYRVYGFSGKQVDLLSERSWEGELADLERPQVSRLQCWLSTPRDWLSNHAVRSALPTSSLLVRGGDEQYLRTKQEISQLLPCVALSPVVAQEYDTPSLQVGGQPY